MLKILGIFLLAVIVPILLITYITPTKLIEETVIVDAAHNNGISGVDLGIENNKIFIDVYTTKHLECDEIVKILDIDRIAIGDIVLMPSCKKIDDNKTKVYFIESVSI